MAPSPHVTFVLASQSQGRLQTLRAAGVDPLVRVSDIDEDEIAGALPPLSSPAQIVAALAEAKAKDVTEKMLSDLNDPLTSPNSSAAFLVLGADSLLEMDGETLGKPKTAEVATQRIQDMRGKDGTLWTGHALALITPSDAAAGPTVWTGSDTRTEVSSTVVHFGDITDEEIAAYVATTEPLHVAGSFTIDGYGGAFIKGVTGDPSSVVGLGLPTVRHLAQKHGIFWPDLWSGSRNG